MLTKLRFRNFKRFKDVEIPLANPVVFVGPNNSGKSTALQALALWELGLRRWKEKRAEREVPEKRPGVVINRRDLLTAPVPSAISLWRGLHVRNVQVVNGKSKTQNIRIEVIVEGNTGGKDWVCGLEFDFVNNESFVCRPLRLEERSDSPRMVIPAEAYDVQVRFLPPMSGLASNETRLDMGAINVRLGEGRTAEVLRNLCYQVLNQKDGGESWHKLAARMEDLFRVQLEEPIYVPERGEITMSYREGGVRLDLSSSGRGLQQTLLLLAFLSLHSGCVLLVDEPDAHLELLRQRDIYQSLMDTARSTGSQIIIASHSEEVLNQAAGTGENSVIAFLGRPHPIPPSRAHALRRALDTVRFDQYYLAEQTGWVLYLEDRTDWRILQAFAERLNHDRAKGALKSPFIVPVGNQRNKGREHFNALLEAKPDLQGYLLVDHDAPELQQRDCLKERKWERREIENYLCQPETLESFALAHGKSQAGGPLFEPASSQRALDSMRKAIRDRVPPAALRNPADRWWTSVKATDDFLDLVFADFFKALNLPLDFRKADYYRLVPHIPDHFIADEVRIVLDEIAEVAAKARPAAMGSEDSVSRTGSLRPDLPSPA